MDRRGFLGRMLGGAAGAVAAPAILQSEKVAGEIPKQDTIEQVHKAEPVDEPLCEFAQHNTAAPVYDYRTYGSSGMWATTASYPERPMLDLPVTVDFAQRPFLAPEVKRRRKR